ncbi:MBL fold metallo-hydrolase [Rhizobium sp. 10PS4]|uniref:MBL fold metallo-hydrolase n=1 Tax=Rhizobium sp. 10PS4 TaxID=3075621 RepID=UPI0029058085|nr:MBL fold metallo-hydrolase [Rhizobium sp. 10PS4]
MISTVEGSPDGVRSANERPVASFSYVYDCGSELSDAFNSEMSLYRAACDGKTDVLFVSHLHPDHINGIDRLQAMAPAKTVIVPYLDVVERLLFVLSDFDRGAASRSSLDYFENPVAWWLGRGVERVIFLQPGRPDDVPPPRGAEPDGPIDDSSAGRRIRLDDAPSKGSSASRLATYMRAPHGLIAEKLTPADPTARETQSGAFVAASGSYLQLEWQAFTGDAWRRAIGFSCPMSIRSTIWPESGFLGTSRRRLVSGEMKRQSSPNRCFSTYGLSKVRSGWSKSTTGISPEDTMRFRCHFTLGRYLNG